MNTTQRPNDVLPTEDSDFAIVMILKGFRVLFFVFGIPVLLFMQGASLGVLLMRMLACALLVFLTFGIGTGVLAEVGDESLVVDESMTRSTVLQAEDIRVMQLSREWPLSTGRTCLILQRPGRARRPLWLVFAADASAFEAALEKRERYPWLGY
jgi:hypothetical protein